ncbi:MAG: DUF3768 domain-containing protein [Pseudomonadota bacterium]
MSKNQADESNAHTAKIRDLNDQFRIRGMGNGSLMITAGVSALGDACVAAIIAAVRTFAAFTADNDPHGEHDFGSLELSGEKLFWKIDYYDPSLEAGSPDPADEAVTRRVLTIMLASEY